MHTMDHLISQPIYNSWSFLIKAIKSGTIVSLDMVLGYGLGLIITKINYSWFWLCIFSDLGYSGQMAIL